MKLASLFSGGKDSTYATYIMMQQGYDIPYLVSILPERQDSYMFHVPNISLTGLLAKAMRIPIIQRTSSGKKEVELKDLVKALESIRDEIDGVVCGAIESEYQKTRVEKTCCDIGLKSFSPLWHKDAGLLLREMVSAGFDIRIVGVYSEGFTANWLGRRINNDTLGELRKIQDKYGIHISGEGGEYETLVTDAPFFKKRVKIVKARKEWSGDSGVYVVEDAALHEKQS